MLSSRAAVCALLLCALSHGSSSQVCQWVLSADQGLSPVSLDSGARHLPFNEDPDGATDVTTACQQACCGDPQCDLALIGTPQDDGIPQCVLVAGCSGDVCVLQPDNQFQAYRRVPQDNDVPSESQGGAGVPETQSDGDKRNATGNTDRCRAPKEVGMCRAAFPKFYYDPANQSCRPFIYGGCGANGNNFETEEECEAACSGVTGSVLEEETPAPAGVPPIAGRSMAGDPSRTEVSEKEVEAEANRDMDDAEDEKVSLPEMSQEDFADHCEAKPVAGPCRASMKRWFYDSGTGTCQSFIYGGCRGNKNNYDLLEECMATCTVTVVPAARRVLPPQPETPDHNVDAKDFADFCLSASDPGPCRAYFPQFYFDVTSGSCRPFVYGGCRGNNNRYLTSEACMDRCAAGARGHFDERGQATPRNRGTAAFFLVATLAVMSALLLAVLVVITVRRSRYTALPRRASTVSDKEELIPESDEQSSVESLSAPGSPVVGKA